jgi:3-oxoacyl-[acyl-carrier protein] reductase
MLNLDLYGHTALVTGASGQLGRVIAPTLAKAGADVAVHYRQDKKSAAAVAMQIQGLGRRAHIFKADLRKPAQVQALKKAVTAKLGAPDILVANAVSQIQWFPVLEQPLKDYVDQFETNVAQNVLLAQAFVPAMKKRGWGRVIAINTEVAIQCLPGQSAYGAAKRGLDGLYRVLARELGPFNINVNQVAPGWTISDHHRKRAQNDKAYVKEVPLGRRGTDQDIANAVAFLASDLASFIHGVYLPVTGGHVMTGL